MMLVPKLPGLEITDSFESKGVYNIVLNCYLPTRVEIKQKIKEIKGVKIEIRSQQGMLNKESMFKGRNFKIS